MVRETNDNYPTPEWVLKSLYPHLPNLGRVLDPCSGDGVFRKVLGDKATFWWDNDIRRECPSDSHVDFLDTLVLDDERFVGYSTIISNPPFTLMQEFVEQAHRIEKPSRIIFLGRLNFLGSKKRKTFWEYYTPTRISVLSKRPSFKGDGTDMTEYAFFWWEPGKGKVPIVDWIHEVEGDSPKRRVDSKPRRSASNTVRPGGSTTGELRPEAGVHLQRAIGKRVEPTTVPCDRPLPR